MNETEPSPSCKCLMKEEESDIPCQAGESIHEILHLYSSRINEGRKE